MELVTTQQVANAPMTAQTYLQAVRDWVATTPAVLEEISEVPVKEAIPSQSPSENATKSIVHQKDRTYPLMQEQIGRSQTQQPKVEQDFTCLLAAFS